MWDPKICIETISLFCQKISVCRMTSSTGCSSILFLNFVPSILYAPSSNHQMLNYTYSRFILVFENWKIIEGIQLSIYRTECVDIDYSASEIIVLFKLGCWNNVIDVLFVCRTFFKNSMLIWLALLGQFYQTWKFFFFWMSNFETYITFLFRSRYFGKTYFLWSSEPK